jgi:hypothetical protein
VKAIGAHSSSDTQAGSYCKLTGTPRFAVALLVVVAELIGGVPGTRQVD